MKKLILIISLSLVALIYWYYQVSKIDNPEESLSTKESKHQNIKSKETIRTKQNNPNKISEENAYITEEDEDIDDDIETDYSEPVDPVEFSDFITAAIEEMENGEEMALAITTEMVKILKAQPKLKDEVIRFYRSCSENKNVASSARSKCQKELRNLE